MRAIARTRMIEAGADATFVEAPLEEDELARIARELPSAGRQHRVRRHDAGSRAAANSARWASASCSMPMPRCRPRSRPRTKCSARSSATARSHAVADRLAGFEERQRAVAKATLRRARANATPSAGRSEPPGRPHDAATKKPWDGIIPQEEQRRLRAAGFGRRTGLGHSPALLIIDVQYRTVGTTPKPFWEAIKEFPTACGEVGWNAVAKIARCSRCSAERNGRCSIRTSRRRRPSTRAGSPTRCRRIMTIARDGYDFVAEVAPRENDILLPKKHPSAFFGTPLASYLIERGADTLVVTGCTTSRMRARQRRRRVRLQFPRRGAARSRLRPQPDVACGQSVRHVGEVRRRVQHR